MHSTSKPKQTDDPHDIVVVAPDVVRVAPADEELSGLLHDAARYLSDAQTHTGSDFPAGPPIPPIDTTFRLAAVNDVLVPGHRRSIGAVVRALTALLLAACICVAAIAWQSYGDAAKQMIAAWVPQSVLTSSQPAQPAAPAAQVDAANAAPSQPAPPARTAAEGVALAAAALSPESAQLQSMARDLASAGQEIEQLKASIEQLKASQQQISGDVAKASEKNLRPKIPRKPVPPPRSAAAPAREPLQPVPPRQAVAAPPLRQAAAPYPLRQPEPQPQTTIAPPADPELSSVPRPPMPVR